MAARPRFLIDPEAAPSSSVPTAVGPADYLGGLVGVLESFPQRGECCIRCGCLCLPDEQCPGCRAAVLQKADELERRSRS